MTRLFIDTSAYSRLMAGGLAVKEALGLAHSVYLSCVVIAELLSGFKKGSREKDNRSILSRFILQHPVKVPSITADTAEFYAQVHAALRLAGRPIPPNDIWIAAQTLEHGATLVTFDQHFTHVPGLMLWRGTT